MAYDWIGISSSNYVDHCEDTDASHKLVDALDGNAMWVHNENFDHWLILDLGEVYTITKVRGRSEWSKDPIVVDIYVSETNEGESGDWGDAVATGISTWRDTATFVEINTTSKDGRYILVKITDCEGTGASNKNISWGREVPNTFTIFDAYGQPTSVMAEGERTSSASAYCWLATEVFSGETSPKKPTDIDPDDVWDEETVEWVTADSRGGSRYRTNIIAIGQTDTGTGCIYYREG
jgi:hypothetical protein